MPGVSILSAAHAAGVEITATCGGRGRCTSCRVKFVAGPIPPPTIMDAVQLGADQVREGYRLSCQCRPGEAVTVQVAPPLEELSLPDAGRRRPDGRAGPRGHRLGRGQAPGLGHPAARGASPDLRPRAAARRGRRRSGRRGAGRAGASSPGPARRSRRDHDHHVRAAHHRGGARRHDLHEVRPGHRRRDDERGDHARRADVGRADGLGLEPEPPGRLRRRPHVAHRLRPVQSRTISGSSPRASSGLLNRHVAEIAEQAGVLPKWIYKAVVVGNTCMHHLLLGIDPSWSGSPPTRR